MALIGCRECGKKISSEALSCPHCGAPTLGKSNKNKNNSSQKIILIIAILSFMWFISQFSTNRDKVALHNTSTETNASCSEGEKELSGRLYVTGKGINFRQGPGTKYPKALNMKATRALGTNQYRTLSPALVLQGLCQSGDWVQAKIVEAEGSPVSWETGWVHNKYVTTNQTTEQIAGLIWSMDDEPGLSARDKEILKRGALKVLKDEPNCNKVIGGHTSTSKPSHYYVMCKPKNDGNYFNVFFSNKSLLQNRASPC